MLRKSDDETVLEINIFYARTNLPYYIKNNDACQLLKRISKICFTFMNLNLRLC